MKTFKTLLAGLVALSAATIATPAQADDHHRHYRDSRRHYYNHGDSWRYHRSPRVAYYSGPRYYRANRYYYYDDYPYAYYRPRYYYGGPRVTIAFGGHRFRHW